jgi:CxxC motif-containing protein (DUF1111 family)
MATTGALAEGELDAVLGKALFERAWVGAPASTDAADGLGPLFAAKSCAGCHAGDALGARFTTMENGRVAGRGLVVRFGDVRGRPDPTYGHLLQAQAVPGLSAEGRIILTATADEEAAQRVEIALAHGPLDPATRRSVRIAPPLTGRAALETIDAEAVLALADPEDRDGDGVSGRARMVDKDGAAVLGRYGWKAATPDLTHQVADAFAIDIGLSSRLRPIPHGDCTPAQADCLAAPTGESERLQGYELSDEMIDLVATFVRSLGARPGDSAAHPSGVTLFAAAGCASCHVPEMPAAGGGAVRAYTDLLLHDMGDALDDGMGEAGVASSEWRTAPLAALAPRKDRRYLHDGRAATLDAAIRAHGGEATAARTRYTGLEESERRTLLSFLEGL